MTVPDQNFLTCPQNKTINLSMDMLWGAGLFLNKACKMHPRDQDRKKIPPVQMMMMIL